MKRILTATALLILVAPSAFGQARLVEKVERTGDELVIPYEKYVLPNGLTLVIHEDHSDPLVHVDVTYHVGSAREEVGKSGFAHFFEHMMFQGSENVGDEQHFRIVQESGGTLNGTTNTDRTNYFETIPSNQLETALWLEADRMGFFLDAVTPQKFEIQRSTVKNERNQNYDNRPYGLVREIQARALYPYGHPYSWLTIGTIEDLDRANLDDLKRFFLRWYGPNNAILTVGGDVDPRQVVALVEKYFGTIPSGPAVERMEVPPVTLTEDRYVSYVDRNIRVPMLSTSFPSVPAFHPDEAPLDYLAHILGGGKASILYRNLVLSGKAVEAVASNPAMELGGTFTIMVLPYPGAPLAETERLVREALAEFERAGVSDDDIATYRAMQESQAINGLTSVSGKVSRLARYQMLLDDPNHVAEDLERYRNVTREDILRVYGQYIKGKNAVILSALPVGMENMAAAPDNFTPTERPLPPGEDLSGLEYVRPTGDTFDRSRRPAPGPNPQVKVPDYWTATFDNGLDVIGTNSDEVPTVILQLEIEGGHLLDAYHPSKAGLADLTADLLDESTQKRSAEDLSEALQKLGSDLSVFAADRGTVITVQSLTSRLDETLALLEEVLLTPGFTQEDFDRVKKQTLEAIEQQRKDPSPIADQVFTTLIYGAGDPRALPGIGTTESVEAITPDDVRAFYRQYYAPSVARLVVVGDVEQDEILGKLGFLKTWAASEVELPEAKDIEPALPGRIYLVDKEGAPQSQVRIGYRTDLPFDATGEFFKTGLMNYVLGGSFSSRINLNLREDKGYTYGARSSFSGNREGGIFVASAGVRANATDSSVAEFVKEITGYAGGGIHPEELSFLRSSIGQRDALRYETPFAKAGFLGQILEYDLDRGFADEQRKIISAITADEINALARAHLPFDRMVTVVVGDKKTVLPGLQRLGYEVVEVDPEGQPL